MPTHSAKVGGPAGSYIDANVYGDFQHNDQTKSGFDVSLYNEGAGTSFSIQGTVPPSKPSRPTPHGSFQRCWRCLMNVAPLRFDRVTPFFGNICSPFKVSRGSSWRIALGQGGAQSTCLQSFCAMRPHAPQVSDVGETIRAQRAQSSAGWTKLLCLETIQENMEYDQPTESTFRIFW